MDSGKGKAPDKWILLAVVCGALFIIMMQNTTINLANPDIMRDFGVGMTTVEWVLTSYMLAFSSFLITMGKVGDAIGRKRTFAIGIVLYSLGGVLAGLSGSIASLIASTVVQGLGGSAMMPATQSLIAANFEKSERGKAMGAWGAVSGLAVVAGPLIGGALAQNGLGPALNALLGIDQGWRYIYFLSAALGVVLFAATAIVIPESRDEKSSFKIDPLGVILSSASLFLLAFGLINGAKHYGLLFKKEPLSFGSFVLDLGRWSPTPIILALSAVLGALFLRREARKEACGTEPLFEAVLFKDPNFAGGSFVTAVLQFAMMGTFFLMPFFLKSVLGLSSFASGLAMIPMAVAVIVVSPLSGALADRIGAKWVIVAGMAVMTVAMLFIANLSPATTLGSLVLPFVLLGVGIGLPMSPTTSAALLDVSVRKVGGASGTLSMIRQVGAILGIAITATIFGNAMPGSMERRVAEMKAPEARLEKKVERVKAMMLAGMKESSASSMGSSDMAKYQDRLSLFFPDAADAQAVAKGLENAVMTGMSDGMNEAFRWAALAPLLGALGAAVFMKNGRPAKDEEGGAATAESGVAGGPARVEA
jgi:EmrB/QacA subfamily drug resistance transporter